MKNQRAFLGTIIIIGVVAVTAVFAAEPARPLESKTWQHLAFETEPNLKGPDTARQINRLGRDGWELVDVTPVSQDGSTEKLIYFFKKPLE